MDILKDGHGSGLGGEGGAPRAEAQAEVEGRELPESGRIAAGCAKILEPQQKGLILGQLEGAPLSREGIARRQALVKRMELAAAVENAAQMPHPAGAAILPWRKQEGGKTGKTGLARKAPGQGGDAAGLGAHGRGKQEEKGRERVFFAAAGQKQFVGGHSPVLARSQGLPVKGRQAPLAQELCPEFAGLFRHLGGGAHGLSEHHDLRTRAVPAQGGEARPRVAAVQQHEDGGSAGRGFL